MEVETNGTVAPLKPTWNGDVDQWNVSPKLDSSGNPRERREQREALEALARLPNAYFKFVVTQPGGRCRGLHSA